MNKFILLGALVVGAVACGHAGDDGGSSAAAAAVASADGGGADSDDVRIIAEPSDRGAALVAAINAATTSVHMTMYELTAPDVMSALFARHTAGVEVKVILDKHSPMPGANPNQGAFTQLQNAGIPVVWSPDTFDFTHEKCVVLDGKTAWIMTMNASESSQVENREYLAVDSDASAVAEAEAQFAADFAGTAYTPSGPLLMSPVSMRPGLTALIASATKTLDFEVEELNDPDLAADFCAAVARHVTVRGLLSSLTVSAPGQKALDTLKGCGVTMGTLAKPYIHAKAIVADGARAYVGSANFSTTSVDHNRELGLVTANPAAVSVVDTALESDIANGKSL